MEAQIAALSHKFEAMEAEMRLKDQENRRLKEDKLEAERANEELRSKLDKLEKRYKHDKGEWK